jgi:putative ABC transport system permease protein
MVISKESIKYSLQGIKKRKGRSALTIFSILIGIVTIFIFISFGYGLYSYVDEISKGSSVDKVLIQAKGMAAPGLNTAFALTDDDLKAIERAGGVYETTGAYMKPAEIVKGNEKKYVFLIGYDPKIPIFFQITGVKIEKGRFLNSGEKDVVLLGNNYMVDGKIFKRGYHINDLIEVQGQKLKIVGFLQAIGNPQDDSQIYITDDFVNDLYPGNNSYGMIVARVDIKSISQVVKNIERNLRKERNLEEGKEDFFVQSFDDMIKTYSNALNIVIGFILLIAFISVIVSAINTANTMITSVLERYKEIGIIKSIGARNSEVFKIFLFESSFLGFVAGSLGVLLGWMLSALAGSILKGLGWGFLQPKFSIWLFIGCIAFATLTGAISGVVPAVRASKINPVDALRYE